MDFLCGVDELVLTVVLYGVSQDCIGMLDEHNYDILVAATGRLWEVTSLVSGYFIGEVY